MKIWAVFFSFFVGVAFAQSTRSAPGAHTDSLNATAQMAAADTDSLDEEEDTQPWMLTIKSEIEKTRISHGIDLSGTNPASNTVLSLLHDNGWIGQVSWSALLGADGGALNWSAALGYDYSLNDRLDVSVTATHTKYLIDSINAVTDLENSLSFDLSADLSIADLTLGYEIYPGANSAHYWTADMSHRFRLGQMSIDLSADITYMSVTIDAAKLDALAITMKRKKFAAAPMRVKQTVAVSGISNYSVDCDFRYDLGRGFRVSFDPSYIVSPKGEVSAKDRQFTWTVGVRYMAEF